MAKKTTPKPPSPVPSEEYAGEDIGTPGTVSIRMYCIGTGDCFIIKFYGNDGKPFTMMIDCGSCRGDGSWFADYIVDLAAYVRNNIDLLIITHEHQDHVNGFQKCEDIFKKITFKNAWFAWTEEPSPEATELMQKRMMMKAALGSALTEIKKQETKIQAEIANSPFSFDLKAAREAFVNGLDSLAEINLDESSAIEIIAEATGKPLAGMEAIKKILKDQKTKVQYLSPGRSVTVDGLPDVNFHVLGPPMNRDFIFKEGKQGTDVFRKNMALNESALAARAFIRFSEPSAKADLPFADEYVADLKGPDSGVDKIYTDPDKNWRTIDDEWLMSAGTLALRLTSHINNTSLALAIESKTGKVLLMPGDAEYGSWESWHLIKSWDKKSKDGKKHLVEDLLNRTAFYKVGHHLSYNGTALEKGINMMPHNNLVAMATLDLARISKGWKSTMPNKYLLADLIKRTSGKFFIMNEKDIIGAPSMTLDPTTLAGGIYKEQKKNNSGDLLYKQCTLEF